MKITESQLRRIIREELLREAAMTPGDAAKNGITFEVQSFLKSVEISAFKDGNSIATLEAEYSRDCDAWPVSKAFSDVRGLGPLLYDLLMDIVHPEPITSDRELVTPAARAVWEYYFSRRPDIEKVDLPEKCPQDSAERHLGDDLWQGSPLSKGYKRRDGSDYLVLGALRKMGIIEGYD